MREGNFVFGGSGGACLLEVTENAIITRKLQWNLDLTKSLNGRFVISKTSIKRI